MSMDKHRNADGTYNGVSALAELAGITLADATSIAEQVKANHAKLTACPYHEFAQLPHRLMHICTNCQGEVNDHAYYWHQLGRRAKP